MKQAVKNILNNYFINKVLLDESCNFFYITPKTSSKVREEIWLIFRPVVNNNNFKMRDLTRISHYKNSVKYSLSKSELQNFVDAVNIYLNNREASQNKAILRCFIREAKLSIRKIAEALEIDTKTVYNKLYKNDLIDLITQDILSNLINSAGVESYTPLVENYIYASYRDRSNSQEDLKDQTNWYKAFKLHQAEVKKKLSELKWTLYIEKEKE